MFRALAVNLIIMKTAILDPFHFDRLGLVAHLQTNHIETVIDTSVTDDFIQYVNRNNDTIDLCILEVDLQENRNGIEVVRLLMNNNPKLNFLLFTHLVPERLYYLLNAEKLYNKCSIISKDIQHKKLLRLIKSINNEYYVFYPNQITNKKLPELTELQIKVIRAVCKGSILKECAKSINMPYKSFASNLLRIMKKMSVHTSYELIPFAMKYYLTKNSNGCFM
ncbi:MAG: hypothetical protein RL624_1868 [Bacteroidota bacterium]|jgi:DNA-binding NarL/FixJ family response regulator